MVDVGRQRNRAGTLHQIKHILTAKVEQIQRITPLAHGGVHTRHGDARPRLRRFAGANMRQCGGGTEHALNQQFNFSAAGLFAKQARLHDARLVEHQQVTALEQHAQIGKQQIAHRAPLRHQQPACPTLRRRKLRNERRRQREVKVSKREMGGGSHRRARF